MKDSWRSSEFHRGRLKVAGKKPDDLQRSAKDDGNFLKRFPSITRYACSYAAFRDQPGVDGSLLKRFPTISEDRPGQMEK